MTTRSFLLGDVRFGDTTYKAAIDTNTEQLVSSPPTYTAFYVLVEKGTQPPVLNDGQDAAFTKVLTPTIEAIGGTDVSEDYDAYALSGDAQPVISHDSNVLVPVSNLNFVGVTFVDGLPIFTNGYSGEEAVIATKAMTKVLAERPDAVDLTAGSWSFKRGGVYVLDLNLGTTHTMYAFTKEGDNFILKNEISNLRRKQHTIAPTEAFDATGIDVDGEKVFFVALVTNLAKDRRMVIYFTGSSSLTLGVELRKASTRAERLEEPSAPTPAEKEVLPVAPEDAAAAGPVSSKEENSSGVPEGRTSEPALELDIPSTERRTRAQLYTALKEAEKFGDRTIRPSKYEGNVNTIGYDNFSHQKIPEWAKELPQGELVSLVTALVAKLMSDKEACSKRVEQAYEAAKDAPPPSNLTQEINIIVGGYGYDH